MRKGLEPPPRRRVIAFRSADTFAHELRPRRLEELAEGHPRWAGCLAAAAAEARIEMARESRRETDTTFGRRPHEVDAPSRRVHLLAEHPIRWTLRQADTAVHAGSEPVHGGRIGRVKGAGTGAGRAHSPPTKRPGLRVPCGSNSALSRFMTARAGSGIGPHTSAARFSSTGARSTTRLPPSAESPSRSGDTISLAQSPRGTLP